MTLSVQLYECNTYMLTKNMKKTRREIKKNVTGYFKHILQATSYKIVGIRLLTSYHTNHSHDTKNRLDTAGEDDLESNVLLWTRHCRLTSKELNWSALRRHWRQFRKQYWSDEWLGWKTRECQKTLCNYIFFLVDEVYNITWAFGMCLFASHTNKKNCVQYICRCVSGWLNYFQWNDIDS